MTYESETTVRDGMVAVHPGLDGRRVRVIVIPVDESPAESTSDPIKDIFAAAKAGIRFQPFSRDEAHQR